MCCKVVDELVLGPKIWGANVGPPVFVDRPEKYLFFSEEVKSNENHTYRVYIPIYVVIAIVILDYIYIHVCWITTTFPKDLVCFQAQQTR